MTPEAPAIQGRLFVIGCARSGTTLLQSFLAAHPGVLSFPESAVFTRLMGGDVALKLLTGRSAGLRQDAREAAQLRLGIPSRVQGAYVRAAALLDKVGRRDLVPLLPGPGASIREFSRGFVAAVDRLALDQGKAWWTEKTPGNLGFVAEIRQLVPAARFINILRDGRQNVASLYEMALDFPHLPWWGKYRNLDEAIARWNICLRRTRRLLRAPDVLLVRYERLLAQTEDVLRELCGFVGMEFSRDMIERRGEAASAVILEEEAWKADVLKPIRPVAENKFDRLFDAEQRAYIESRLERVDF